MSEGNLNEIRGIKTMHTMPDRIIGDWGKLALEAVCNDCPAALLVLGQTNRGGVDLGMDSFLRIQRNALDKRAMKIADKTQKALTSDVPVFFDGLPCSGQPETKNVTKLVCGANLYVTREL
jgi:hypothetical protein